MVSSDSTITRFYDKIDQKKVPCESYLSKDRAAIERKIRPIVSEFQAEAEDQEKFIRQSELVYGYESQNIALLKDLVEIKKKEFKSNTLEILNIFRMAILNGNFSCLKFMSKDHMDLESLNYLILGPKKENERFLKNLVIDSRLKINIFIEEILAVLEKAAEQGDIDLVRYLTSVNTEIEEPYFDGTFIQKLRTFLDQTSTLKGDKEIVESWINIILRTEGKFAGRGPLQLAALKGKLDLVKHLINLGFDVDKIDNNRNTVLHFAALSGNLDLVMYLVETCKLDIKAVDCKGRGVIHLAAQSGNITLIRYLLSKIEEERNRPTLTKVLASLSGNSFLLDFLEEHFHVINSKDVAGRDILHYAALSGNKTLFEYLLSHHNLNVNSLDCKGRSSVFYAALSGNIEFLEYLCLEHNLNLSLIDTRGRTLLYNIAKTWNFPLLYNLALSTLVTYLKTLDCEKPYDLIDKIFKSLKIQLAEKKILRSEKEQIIDSSLSKIYRTIISGKSHIVIRVLDKAGYGDLLFAMKLTEMISKNIPEAKIAIVFQDEKTISKVRSIASEYPFEKNCYSLRKLPAEFKSLKNGLCIGAATFYDEEETVKDLKYDQMGLPDKYPFLRIPEYGCTYKQEKFYEKSKVTGLCTHEFGIFIDPKIISAIESFKEKKQNPLLHINNLIDKSLQKQILQNASDIESYSQRSNLYFGYAHSTTSHVHFIKAVANLEKGNDKNVDLILILDNPLELDLLITPEVKSELRKAGFGKIKIAPTEQTSFSTLKISLKSSKVLRIIPKNSLVHKDVETCLIMSRPLSLVTGDQSISEAISAGKIFIYELWSHKIQFEKSLKELAKHLNLPLVELYLETSVISDRDFSSSPQFLSYGRYFHKNPQDYEDLTSKFLTSPDFYSQWDCFIKYIQQNKSLEDRIIPRILRSLAENKFPVLSDIIKAIQMT